MNYKQSSYETSSKHNCHKMKAAASAEASPYDYVYYCYSSEAVKNIDFLMVDQGFVDNSYELMLRAAQA